MSTDAALARLVAEKLVPLRREWHSDRQAALLTEARRAEAVSLDNYWEWAAKRFRWSAPWRAIREGGFGDLRYFPGGMINVADNCIDRYAEDPRHGAKTALIWEGEPGDVRTLSYAALRDEVARCANALRALGIGKGDVVGIYMPNLPEAFVAIHACNRIGAIYTVLFAGFSADAVATRLRSADAKLVVTADAAWRRGRQVPLLANLRHAVKDVPSIEAVIVVDRTGERPELSEREFDYAALLSAQSDDCPCLPLEANEPAFLIFTSGTESKPKGVVHSTAGFLIGTWANVQWQVGLDDEDVYWCAADVGWLTFPIQAVIGGLAHGQTLVCYEGALDFPSRSRFYDIAASHGVTKILTAPTVLRMLRAAGDDLARAHPLPKLRLITLQGEPLDPETFNWANRTLGADGVPVTNAYGQTETGSTWTMAIYGVDDLKPGSCGQPVPGHAYAIVDVAGEVVPSGTRGNLVLTQPFPTLARTIWHDHERYLSTYFRAYPGCYRTADEAVVDGDGHLWVLGRADDVINVAAHRISTMEIESVVGAQRGVAEAAVVGVSDKIKGTVPIAFLTLRPDADPDAVREAVAASVVGAIGGIARLDRIYVLPAMPKTRAGKIMRRLLREAGETGTVGGDLTGLEDPETVRAVIAVVARAASSS